MELKTRLETVVSIFSFSQIDPEVRQQPIHLRAEDGGESRGILYTKSKSKTAITVIHPRSDNSRHYAIPSLLHAGYAVFGHASRWTNNDIEAVPERLLLDVAAAVRFLRGTCGYERVVLLGNSGGGALYTFYIAQASTAPPGRQTHTPAGDPLDLNKFDLPAVDGIVQLATHAGTGKFLMTCIDASVTDEHDPMSRDPELDMYDPRNGFRLSPESSHYSEEFLEKYRAAQVGRVARLDAIARGRIDEQNYHQSTLDDSAFKRLSVDRQLYLRRRAVLGHVMVIYRTMANPTYVDLLLDPSDRERGTIRTDTPEVYNYTEFGYARVLTPRAWLCTWSGLSSNASTVDNARKVTVPTVVIGATADREVLPQQDILPLYDATASKDKQLVWIEGADHFFMPSGPKAGAGDQREKTFKVVTSWLRERFNA